MSFNRGGFNRLPFNRNASSPVTQVFMVPALGLGVELQLAGSMQANIIPASCVGLNTALENKAVSQTLIGLVQSIGLTTSLPVGVSLVTFISVPTVPGLGFGFVLPDAISSTTPLGLVQAIGLGAALPQSVIASSDIYIPAIQTVGSGQALPLSILAQTNLILVQNTGIGLSVPSTLGHAIQLTQALGTGTGLPAVLDALASLGLVQSVGLAVGLPVVPVSNVSAWIPLVQAVGSGLGLPGQVATETLIPLGVANGNLLVLRLVTVSGLTAVTIEFVAAIESNKAYEVVIAKQKIFEVVI